MAAPAPTDIGSLLVVKKGFRQGRPCLRGTGITVHSVAAAHLMGYSGEEICAQNPDLDPSLFHAALAYYFANRKRVEAELSSDDRAGAEMAARHPRTFASS
ncbi:MAG: DUF433 domain-containing protein [Chloroflexi bacterium]|nr:DUF433 domain-containing protein [Chloroflexota bacterium]